MDPQDFGRQLIADHVYKTNSLSKSLHNWHQRVRLHRRRRTNKCLALEFWYRTNLHKRWLSWLQYIGQQHRQHALNTPDTTNTVPTRPTYNTTAPTLPPRLVSSFTPVRTTPIQNTPPRHPHSSSTTTTTTTTTTRRRRKRSSRTSRSIGRRSWTAYKHAASRLTMRVFGAWAHQTTLRLEQFQHSLLVRFLTKWKHAIAAEHVQRDRMKLAATHRIRSYLKTSWCKLRRHAQEAMHLDECERIARRFSYFHTLQSTMNRWMDALRRRRQYYATVVQAHVQKRMFRVWWNNVRPDVLVVAKQTGQMHYRKTLQHRGVQRLRAHAQQRQRAVQLHALAVSHWCRRVQQHGKEHSCAFLVGFV
jgi:hypothetical protein